MDSPISPQRPADQSADAHVCALKAAIQFEFLTPQISCLVPATVSESDFGPAQTGLPSITQAIADSAVLSHGHRYSLDILSLRPDLKKVYVRFTGSVKAGPKTNKGDGL